MKSLSQQTKLAPPEALREGQGHPLSEEGSAAPSYADHLHPMTENYDQVDVLSQLKANLACIDDLNFRLGFMLGEVRTLIKK